MVFAGPLGCTRYPIVAPLCKLLFDESRIGSRFNARDVRVNSGKSAIVWGLQPKFHLSVDGPEGQKANYRNHSGCAKQKDK